MDNKNKGACSYVFPRNIAFKLRIKHLVRL